VNARHGRRISVKKTVVDGRWNGDRQAERVKTQKPTMTPV
jgi:hypothetical protein